MNKFGVNTQRWALATNPAEAKEAAKKLKCKEYVVKSQIHAGGRGKGHFLKSGFKGGVHLTTDPNEVEVLAGSTFLFVCTMFASRFVARAAATPSLQPKRFLNIHEYQSKGIMNKFGVNTQRWALATNPAEAKEAAKKLKCKEYVVKSQIHAGGRGKGHFLKSGFKGGVHLTTDPNEVEVLAGKMLGDSLVTNQTTKDGVLVNKLMIAESLDFNNTHEKYFAIVMDRAFDGPVMIASPMGGMDIEHVAEVHPDKIFKRKIDYLKGIQPEDTKYIAESCGFKNIEQAQQQMANLYELFKKTDAVQVEINPLVELDSGDIYCIDAKIGFDDNASYRQQEIYDFRDTAEEDQREVEASKHNLNYIGMEGNIACMVNGAGLAMATMDIIKLYGGEPANFLDVGGGASEEMVVAAFKILTSDPQVKAILVNIFGGIVKCDMIATGIIAAAKQVGLKIPLVVRLEGTNVEKGVELMKNSGLAITSAVDLDDAAQKAVKSVL
eukprot:TRINITY_DN49_c0_g1_i1.p1 TRINITY_DN49_c0_g1~~TRINITY_DN49_c0_g1_i1.p1  ORF type:complete len:543 (+),score=298.51 TRINITY_DN49_c0_g1_i1:145-1629(+)